MRYILLAVILLSGCASVQDTHDDSIIVNAGYDQAWRAAVQALSATGFSVKNSDKDSGILYAEGGRNLFTQNEAPQMNILVNEIEPGRTRITARAVQAGQLYDWGAGKGNSKKFFDALRANLP
jgi:hypothetical protein